MFKIGDYVNYSAQGICRIEDLRKMSFGGGTNDYYILKPIGKDCSQIFVPAGNEKLVGKMRAVLSAGQIDKMILSAKDRSFEWIDDRKEREAFYRKILVERNEVELLVVARALYERSKVLPKGLSNMDSGVLKKIETIIAEEFSFALEIPAEKTGEYIREKLNIE